MADKRAFDLGLKLANDTTQLPSVRTAAAALVGAAGKGDARAFPLVFDRFKKALESGNAGDIMVSLRGLITIADPRGQEAFDLLKAKYKNNPGAMAAIGQYEAEFKAAIKQ